MSRRPVVPRAQGSDAHGQPSSWSRDAMEKRMAEAGRADATPGRDASDGIDWVLGTGTLGFDSPAPARIDAALASGFGCVTVGPLDVARAAKEGGHAERRASRIGAHGVVPLTCHPSGVSRWLNEPENVQAVERAMALLRDWVRELGI